MNKLQTKEVMISTRFGSFLCVFEPNDPEQGFTVTALGAPGFVTGGRTFTEAKRMAREGLEFHCECVILENAFQSGKHKTLAPAM